MSEKDFEQSQITDISVGRRTFIQGMGASLALRLQTSPGP